MSSSKSAGAAPFLAGATSGGIANLLTQPFDVVKTTMIANNFKTTNAHQRVGALVAAKTIYQQGGVSALYRGSIPTLFRVVPGAAIYFGLVHEFSSLARSRYATSQQQSQSSTALPSVTPLDGILIGATARAITTAIVSPITIIKTRFEYSAATAGEGVIPALRRLYRVEGVRGLFSGLGASILRDAPYSGLFYCFYNYLKSLLAVESSMLTTWVNGKLELTAAGQMLAAATSSVLATAATHPADVIRTMIQLNNAQQQQQQQRQQLSIGTVFRNAGGFSGMFRGLAPRLAKRSISSGISWTLYESLVNVYAKMQWRSSDNSDVQRASK